MEQIFTMDVERDIDAAVRFAEILRKKGNVGEFYICGDLVEKYPEKVKKIAEDHILGGHGYYHEDFAKLSNRKAKAVILKTINIFKKKGLSMQGWRFPYLSYNKKNLNLIAKYELYDSSINRKRIGYGLYVHKGVHLLSKNLIEKPWDYADLQEKEIFKKQGRLISHCYNLSGQDGI
jgi:peptidoglycan/xylan/chitin deacetylase (PgdA/CDA1 family)